MTTLVKPMTAAVAVDSIAKALEAVQYLHKSQQDILGQDGERELKKRGSDDFTMKDTRVSEGTRANHERLVKALSLALKRAQTIANAEAAIMKHGAIPTEAVRVVKTQAPALLS